MMLFLLFFRRPPNWLLLGDSGIRALGVRHRANHCLSERTQTPEPSRAVGEPITGELHRTPSVLPSTTPPLFVVVAIL